MYELRITRPKETRIREYPNWVKARKAYSNAVRLNQGSHVMLTDLASGKTVRATQPIKDLANED